MVNEYSKLQQTLGSMVQWLALWTLNPAIHIQTLVEATLPSFNLLC